MGSLGGTFFHPCLPQASFADGLCRTGTSLLVGQRAFPATLIRRRGKAQLGLCSDPLPLVLSCPCSWQQGGLCGGSLYAVLWTMMYLPADNLGHQFCLTTGAGEVASVLKVMLPKPNTTHLCTRSGNHRNVTASSMFLFQEAGQSPGRRLAQHQTPCLRNWKGIVPGQMDMPKLTAPVLGLVPQSCAPLPAHHGHLLPWLQLGAYLPCHSAMAYTKATTKLLAVPWLWSSTKLTCLL